MKGVKYMSKPKIIKVKSNMNKHYTYLELNKRKKQAFKEGNYLEVIQYSYAMIEDRLLSILHYLYVVNRNEYPYKLEKYVEESITKLLYPKRYIEENMRTSSPCINNINTKLNIIKKIYNYKKDDENILLMRKKINDVINIKLLKMDISRLETWKEYRNEFTHTLYNKDLDDINIHLREQAKIGIELSERFDEYADILKGKVNNTKSLRSFYEAKVDLRC